MKIITVLQVIKEKDQNGKWNEKKKNNSINIFKIDVMYRVECVNISV